MEEYNSYLFMVLAHEYLHSFGIVDEFRVRQMTYDLCSSLLGKEHPTSIMAKEDPSALFPELALLRETRLDKHFEIVKNFGFSPYRLHRCLVTWRLIQFFVYTAVT
jgi:hypothetical protein